MNKGNTRIGSAEAFKIEYLNKVSFSLYYRLPPVLSSVDLINFGERLHTYSKDIISDSTVV